MQNVAIVWLIYRLTNSAFLLGLVGFASQFPTFLFSPFAGAFADRVNRRMLFLITQILATVQSLALFFLVITNRITVSQIIILSILMGLISAFDMPARQAFVVDMIEKKEDLGNAIALNSLLMNSTRMVGPAMAGIIIATSGEALCFFLNSMSYLFIIFALIQMQIVPKKTQVKETSIIKTIKEGFKYAYNSLPIRLILLVLALFSFFAMPYTVVLPIFAKQVFHGGADYLGYLMTGIGIGALIGALYVASRKNVVGLEKLLSMAGLIFGVSICFFALSRQLWLSLALLTFSGFGMFAQITCSNTILQSIVEDSKRGRIMSLYTMAFMGMAPLGSLYIGWAAHYFTAQNALLISGLVMILTSLLFIKNLNKLKNMIHPIYRQQGIMPEVAEGLKTAANLTNKPQE